jgi:hypothetical protein
VANWVKLHLEASGIDTTKFKAHSIRSAASTAAVESGALVMGVKLHANWSLKSDTSEQYYHGPSRQHGRGGDLAIRLFNTAITEKRTTSEVGVEPTTIVLGTTHNKSFSKTVLTEAAKTSLHCHLERNAWCGL